MKLTRAWDWTRAALPFLGLVLLAALLLLVCPPILSQIPDRDAGVFLYVGDRILHGEVPYRDVWDHKTPLIFYLNALGLWLGGRSLWGVWFLELFSLSSALTLGFHLLRRLLGSLPAWVGTLSWALALVPLFTLGNFTEEFAIPLKFVALWALLAPFSPGRGLWLGATGVLAFLLKPNLIGLHAAVVLVLIGRSLWDRAPGKAARDLSWCALGGLAIMAPLCGYLMATHAWKDFLDQGFFYNSLYGQVSLAAKLKTARFGFTQVGSAAYFGLAACVLALGTWIARRSVSREETALLAAGVLGLGFEIVLASISGRDYPHYFLAWLPVLGLLNAWLIAVVLRVWPAKPVALKVASLAGVAAIAWLNLGPIGVSYYHTVIRMIKSPPDADSTRIKVAQFLARHTRSDQTVLVWGAESIVNFVADRKAPTRFVYQYPLLMNGYHQQRNATELLTALQEQKPPFILDTSIADLGFPPLFAARRRAWKEGDPTFVEPICQYIEAHYVVDRQIGEWQLLALKRP